tara:strand:+ start:197 stop:1534 length:1338 start_codon:yes stop_codon:yes gene_type:complete
MSSSSETKSLHELQEKIFDIKDKITSQDYLTLMNLAGDIFKKTTNAGSSQEAGSPQEVEEFNDDDHGDDDDDDDDYWTLELTEDMLVTIGDTQYYKTSYDGIDNLLFSYPEGDIVGELQPDGITIDRAILDDDDDYFQLESGAAAAGEAAEAAAETVHPAIVALVEEAAQEMLADSTNILRDAITVNQTNELFSPPDFVDLDWRDKLCVGSLVDARDPYGNWYEAIVINIFGPLHFSTPNGLQIKYRGWGDTYNENISRDSIRIAPPFTFIENWRKNVKVGSVIEAKPPGSTKWYFASVTNIDTNRIGSPNNPLISFQIVMKHDNRISFDDHIASCDYVSPLYTHNKVNPSFKYSPLPIELFLDGHDGKTNSEAIIKIIHSNWAKNAHQNSPLIHPEFIYRLDYYGSSWKGWNFFLKDTPLTPYHINFNKLRDHYEKIAFDKLNL